MLKNFETGWKKQNIGTYKLPIWELELIDSQNSRFKFKLAVKKEFKDKLECTLSGFLKDDYTFYIPIREAKDSDNILDHGKIFKWVMDKIGKFLCPKCN